MRIEGPDEAIPVGRAKRIFAPQIAVVLIICLGIALRMMYLEASPFWVDEAESSINALTILQHGYPSDTYLGMPIFENTHVWFWPENPEYEFHDVSYSIKHFAAYHSWLPLYAIAGSFALHGIRPDEADGSLTRKHTVEDQKLRTRAARLPSVFFAAVFLGLVFLGGKALCGNDAGWAALFLAAIHPYHLFLSGQARYYSAEVALTTACCVALWLLLTRRTWTLVVLAGVAFVLLFHTHLLSFLTAGIMAGICIPVMVYRHQGSVAKMASFGVIVAAGTIPWLILTGFYDHQSRIPRAWELLQIPSDLLRYQPFRFSYILAGLLLAAPVYWLVWSGRRDFRLLKHVARSLGPAMLFLMGWGITGYVTFLLFIPAVSFTKDRMNLSYWGPLFLLFAVGCAAVVRILRPGLKGSMAAFTTTGLMLAVFFAVQNGPAASPFADWQRLATSPERGEGMWKLYSEIFDQLDAMHCDRGTKMYAGPNQHLVLSFYSGLPIQDITPVRRSFLDSYPGEIVYIDLGVTADAQVLTPQRVQEAALADGYRISDDAAAKAALLLRTRDYREEMTKALAPGSPVELEPVPLFARPLLTAHRDEVRSSFANSGYELFTRGFEVRNWSEWVAILKYRFVNPTARMGVHANYVSRLRGAEAMILAGGVAMFRSRWHPAVSTAPVYFRFVGEDSSALDFSDLDRAMAFRNPPVHDATSGRTSDSANLLLGKTAHSSR